MSVDRVHDHKDVELIASLRRLAANMGELAGVSSVAVVLLDPASGELETRVVLPSSAPASAGAAEREVAPEEAIEGKVATRLEPVIVEDTRAEPAGRGQRLHFYAAVGVNALETLCLSRPY